MQNAVMTNEVQRNFHTYYEVSWAMNNLLLYYNITFGIGSN